MSRNFLTKSIQTTTGCTIYVQKKSANTIRKSLTGVSAITLSMTTIPLISGKTKTSLNHFGQVVTSLEQFKQVYNNPGFDISSHSQVIPKSSKAVAKSSTIYPLIILSPNYFMKNSSPSSFLLSLGDNTGLKWQWSTQHNSSMF